MNPLDNYVRKIPFPVLEPARGRVVVGFDLETRMITKEFPAPEPACGTFYGDGDIPACFDGLIASYLPGAAKRWNAIVSPQDLGFVILSLWSDDVITVAHNATFDFSVLVRWCGIPQELVCDAIESGLYADTIIRDSLRCVFRGHGDHRSLSRLIQSYFRIDISGGKKKGADGVDPWRYRYGELIGVDINSWPIEAVRYALADAEWAYKAFWYQAQWCPASHSMSMADELRQTRASWALRTMSLKGPTVVPTKVVSFEEAHQRIYQEAVDFCIPPIPEGATTDEAESIRNMAVPWLWYNPKRSLYDEDGTLLKRRTSVRKKPLEEAVVAAYAKFGMEVPRNKPTKNAIAAHNKARVLDRSLPEKPLGSRKLSREVLTVAFMEEADPYVYAYARAGNSEKMLNQYVPILRQVGPGARLRSSPNVLVSSGRTSWTKPNMQNPPREGGFRDCFVPAKEGWCFAFVDYSSIESCALAQICLWRYGFSRLADVINSGKDSHLVFAAELLLGITYEEAYARRKDPDVKAARSGAKAGAFGVPGGMGPKTIALTYSFYLKALTKMKGFSSDIETAKYIKEGFVSMYSELVSYFRSVKQVSGTYDNPKKFYYRNPTSGRVRGGCTYTSGANTQFQGLAADGAKDAMWDLHRAIYDEGGELHNYGVEMWVFIHDEFGLQGPKATAHLWAPIVSRIMCDSMSRHIPDVVIKAPPAICSAWYKDADTVYDSDGVLLPWFKVDTEREGDVFAASSRDFPGVVVYGKDSKEAESLFRQENVLRWDR